MSIARRHVEWLSLVEASGPFLSLPVLLEVFPQGLDKPADEAEVLREVREAHAEWESAADRKRLDSGIYRAWLRFVLKDVLDLPNEVILEGQAIPGTLKAEVLEQGEILRPDWVVKDSESAKPRMLVQFYSPAQKLEKSVAGKRWQASPGTRMMELLHATDCLLGLVTNGEHWMLVYAPRGDTTGFASWYATLWQEEPVTLRALRALLGASRLFGVQEKDTLEGLLKRSAANQQEVTDQLGYQVRRAVEVIVEALDKADRELNGKLLAGVRETRLYEAAVTVMMRLVFLMCAEERKLLPVDSDLYQENYAISTILDLLQTAADQHGEEILETRHDAWHRLLATFRAVHGGIRHDRLRLPAYGGSLFDPDRFPFLEGRAEGTAWKSMPAKALPVNNRVTLHLLRALQRLEVRLPGGGPAESRRLSFRALDIEQIGHVYEGLLDHTAIRAVADQPVLGLSGTKHQEPEVEVKSLESLLAKDREALIEFLKEETGRSPAALKRALQEEPDPERIGKFRAACGNSEKLFGRLRPFLNLVRDDTFGYPMAILGGSVYVTQGSDRRSTGTHYTPRSLTEPVVQHTLEPLVYEGPAEGKERKDWKLKSPRQLLALKICDMAMGSGAFLVATCRYLSERLVEAWVHAEQSAASSAPVVGTAVARSGRARATVIRRPDAQPSRVAAPDGFLVHEDPAKYSERDGSTLPAARPAPRITPEGDPSTGRAGEQLIPDDPDERLVFARRLVADRCLYGVDINPMAVEMAKLSLWLGTLDKGRAFSFLDHALKCGDSLLGFHSLEQVETLHIAPQHADSQPVLWQEHIRSLYEGAAKLRRELESFTVRDASDSQRKAVLNAAANDALDLVRTLCDLVTGAAIANADGEAGRRGGAPSRDFERERENILVNVAGLDFQHDQSLKDSIARLKQHAQELLNKHKPAGKASRRPFHYPVEFPEVFPPRALQATVQQGVFDFASKKQARLPLSAPEGSSGGFCAIVGNPPFRGGKMITGVLGTDYRFFLMDHQAAGVKGHADLCAYFFLQAMALLRGDGGFGLLATNTLAQGDTREVGLDQIAKTGGTIHRAVPSRPWPGAAALEVAHVWCRKGAWKGGYVLDEKAVPGITPFLAVRGKVAGNPYRLKANESKSFQGSIVLGMGFVLAPEEAQALIRSDIRNKDVLFPYLNGEDLNSRPDQSPSRWVINFHDWPLERSAKGSWAKSDDGARKAWLREGLVPKDYPDPVAMDYPDCLKILEEEVKPERTRRNAQGEFALRHPLYLKWWIYADKRPALYATIKGMERVFVIPETTKYCTFTSVAPGFVFSHMTKLIACQDGSLFSCLLSSVHEVWARENSSTLETRLKYITSDAFETFPFPRQPTGLKSIGERYAKDRQKTMLESRKGLTESYNRFHDPDEKAPDIAKLRELHVEMDHAVALAYGWPIVMDGKILKAEHHEPGTPDYAPFDLGHGFHQTKQGLRFTVSPAARQEILDRLLALNHKRYAEEVKAGLHDKKAGKVTGSRRKCTTKAKAPEEGGLFDQV